MASAVLATVSAQDKPAPFTKTIVVGRVLASVDSLIMGAGLSSRYETFIFGLESKGEHGKQVIIPIEVLYVFYKWDDRLRDSFFDHSKQYEFRVERDSKCDEKVSVLSYEKNEDSNGKQLPPTYILRLMEGAPKDLLKPDSILPCYRLTPGNYQELK